MRATFRGRLLLATALWLSASCSSGDQTLPPDGGVGSSAQAVSKDPDVPGPFDRA